jgi:flavin reductase
MDIAREAVFPDSIHPSGTDRSMKDPGRELRQLMSRFVTGVTVVAARDPGNGEPHGLTANSVCSVSLDPPLVLVCVSNRARTHAVIARARSFSVSVLCEGQEAVSRRFAEPAGVSRFDGVEYRVGATGAPILSGALAWLECRLWASYPGGDHTIYVGEVVGLGGSDGRRAPLVFYRGRYDAVLSSLPAREPVPAAGWHPAPR